MTRSPVSPNSQLDGVFVLNKPSGPSSAGCLRIFKRLGQKKTGHAGTLDPMAAGVLVTLLGQATKLSPWLLAESKKIYSGVIHLGEETDTWDAEGAVTARAECLASPEEIGACVKAWELLEEQEVPEYSAAKHQGQPLYRLARKGAQVPRKVKKINVYEAGMLSLDMPFVRFRVHCASGVYIRSLAHSLGKRLGCGAHLCELTREYSHPFDIAQASSLADLEAEPRLLSERTLPLAACMPAWMRIDVSRATAAMIRNGQPIPAREEEEGRMAFLCHEDAPLAIGRLARSGRGFVWTVVRGLWN